jgi:tetratricopeptide (TPR) repeat protein
MKALKQVCVSSLLVLVAVSAAAGSEELGVIDFPNSAPETAQADFIRGVLLLHSFQYPQAAEAFRATQKLAPDFALGYWGEAMTHNHGLWMEQDPDQARAVLAKLGPAPEARLAKAPTEREKGYMRAVEALFGEGSKVARDLSYMEHMRQLHEKYPDDLEAASFYALSILASAQGERDFRAYMQAAAIAQQVANRNPKHPGAIHYIIHSYDDPIHAPLGLPAANVYAKIAPAATHALHMPSHIFLALGMWDDTVASNEASYEASNGKSYHALQWLAYGYLQQGRQADAARMLEKMRGSAAKDDSPGARWYLGLMRSAYVFETRQWDAADFPVNTEGIEFSAAASDLLARGVSAVQAGRLPDAKRVLQEMRTRRAPLAKRAADPLCHQTNFSAGISPNGLKGAAVMEQELEAMILLAQHKPAEAIALLEQAAFAEDEMAMDFGPPNPVKPAHELLAETLLAQGKFEDAKTHFELALKRAPGRRLSLEGLSKATQAGAVAAAK